MPCARHFGSARAGGCIAAPTYLAAQEPNKAEADRQSAPAQAQGPSQTTAPMGTNPGTMGGQPQAPIANQASPADVGPAQANTANAELEWFELADGLDAPDRAVHRLG